MKIGLLAFSTQTGLGIQTQSFYRHMKPTKTLIADLSKLNNMPTQHDMFKDGEVKVADGIPNCEAMDWLTNDVDVVFVCETPLNYCLFEKAQAKGVKTILQYNYEFLDYLNQPQLAKPTVLAAPTIWHKDDVISQNFAPVIDLPVPSDVSDIITREINECRTIMHIAGRQAIHDRNGTMTFIEAAIKCGNKFKYIIYAQQLDGTTETFIEKAKAKINIEVVYDIPNYQDMYKTGDVLVLPRKYGGLCLPMQEALSAGIPVIMPDVSPNEYRLPKQWLVSAKRTHSFMTRTQIDIYETDPNWLAFKMCEFASSDFMQWSNKEAIEIGKGLSWETLKAYYQTVFAQIIQG